MHKRSFYIINAITAYRLAASALLLLLIFGDRQYLFSWLLAISFFTNLVDGLLARKYKVVSIFGSRLDSVADDLTFLMAAIGVFVWKRAFLHAHYPAIEFLLGLYLLQTLLALLRYRKISSFHTYLAKCAALTQGFFLILLFFLEQPLPVCFYLAAAFTGLDLIEEIVIVLLLPQWRHDVKGLYWILKGAKQGQAASGKNS